MAKSTEELVVEISADVKDLKQGLSQAQKETKKTSSSMIKSLKGVGAAMGLAFGGAEIINFTKDIILLGAKFDKTMSRVAALTKAVGQDFKDLENLALRMGTTTEFTASQAAEAMTFLSQAGFDTNQIMKALPGTLQLASAAQLELARAADIASNVLSGYGLEASQINRVNDILVSTANNANTSVEQFAEAFKTAGPIARSAGVEIEEVASVIGILGNAGIQGSLAGTQLRGVISSLINPTAEAQKTLARLGVETTDVDGKLRSINDVMNDLGRANATTSDLFVIFGERAASAGSILSQTTDDVKDFTNVIKEDVGIAAEVAAKQLDNLSGDLTKLGSVWEGIWLKISKSGQGVFRRATQWVTLFLKLENSILNLVMPANETEEAFKDVNEVFGETNKTAREMSDLFNNQVSLSAENLGMGMDHVSEKTEKAKESFEDFAKRMKDIENQMKIASFEEDLAPTFGPVEADADVTAKFGMPSKDELEEISAGVISLTEASANYNKEIQEGISLASSQAESTKKNQKVQQDFQKVLATGAAQIGSDLAQMAADGEFSIKRLVNQLIDLALAALFAKEVIKGGIFGIAAATAGAAVLKGIVSRTIGQREEMDVRGDRLVAVQANSNQLNDRVF